MLDSATVNSALAFNLHSICGHAELFPGQSSAHHAFLSCSAHQAHATYGGLPCATCPSEARSGQSLGMKWQSQAWLKPVADLCRLQTAIQNVALEQSGGPAAFQEGSKGNHPSAKHLKPITQAMELVFGSAAAISAAFGLKVCPPYISPSDGWHQ